jgi:hypothetical protein
MLACTAQANELTRFPVNFTVLAADFSDEGLLVRAADLISQLSPRCFRLWPLQGFRAFIFQSFK